MKNKLKIIDRTLKFDGFSGTDGACHIRILPPMDGHKPVIVCSQLNKYYGTSVTNGFELIAATIFYGISRGDFEVAGVSITASKHAKGSFWNRFVELFKPVERVNPVLELLKKFIWIERYPSGTGLLEREDDLRQVTVNDKLQPCWHNKLDNESVIKLTGYSLDVLKVDDSALAFDERDRS